MESDPLRAVKSEHDSPSIERRIDVISDFDAALQYLPQELAAELSARQEAVVAARESAACNEELLRMRFFGRFGLKKAE